MKKTALVLLSLSLLVLLWLVVIAEPKDDVAAHRDYGATTEPPTWVGRSSCGDCHEQQTNAWQDSHHDLAMQPATDDTVLGDFEDANFRYAGTTSTFFRDDERFMVRTEGPDGELEDYEIRFTFGVEPLQQYLIEFPGGRLQALNICWDTRPESQGGQRWFHLYPDEAIDSDDVLHWTRLLHNWNFMCAECHSTDVERGYRLASDRFETSYHEIDVSCEACHGPASRHVDWAREQEGSSPQEAELSASEMGLEVDLRPEKLVWGFVDGKVTAQRSSAPGSKLEIETCGRCHARRSPLGDGYQPGEPLMNSHRVSLLDEQLYHPDGQVQDEVYVYGSFLQSRMYKMGVTCSDCHDPHSLELREAGNAVCATCHSTAEFDTRAHHHHPPDTAGTSCAECHMPPTTYMVVDPRHDHSLRVPRPDLAVELGTPDPCTTCHAERTSEWAAGVVAEWYPSGRQSQPHYGQILAAARRQAPAADLGLSSLLSDPEMPAIVRGTALTLLSWNDPERTATVVKRASSDLDPMVRLGAVLSLELAPAQPRLDTALPLLDDDMRAVRIAAARVLASVPESNFTQEQLSRLNSVLVEYQRSQRSSADRPESHLNLGLLNVARGDLAAAELDYQKALEIEPHFVGGYVNLSDLYRQMGRDLDADATLRKGLEIEPNNADLAHSLGLVLVRLRRTPEALQMLELAADAAPEVARYSYVYGVALHSSGEVERAITVLEGALERHPGSAEILQALASFHRDRGSIQEAIRYAERLVELLPQDPGARQLLQQLQ